MNCNVVKDLIPLYIDSCCSEESQSIVQEHIADCPACRTLLEQMQTPAETVTVATPPATFRKLNDWKASLMQSLLLFCSFALITIGVALEARIPWGLLNGFWAFNLVIPATGFLLSLANWYFVRLYPNKKRFSDCSLLATLGITLGATVWALFHYEIPVFSLFEGLSFSELPYFADALFQLNGLGILLTTVCCVLSKILSARYAKMLGKE